MSLLPQNFIPDVTRLLLPLMQMPEERDMWLSQAFYYTDPRIYYQLDRTGATLTFVNRCIRFLWEFGCFPNGTHPLSDLLNAVKTGCSADKQIQIDGWISQLDGTCAESRMIAAVETEPATAGSSPLPLVRPVQSIAVPAAERTPTVFVSYTRKDEAVARRLIADLNSAGHACWFDQTSIKSDDTWSKAISAGINNSYAFITLVSEAANASKWVLREYLAADEKTHLPILVLQLEACEIPIQMKEKQATRLFPSYQDGLNKLLASLPIPTLRQAELVPSADVKRTVSQRELELEYLSGLRLENWLKTIQSIEQYTPLTGMAQINRARDAVALMAQRYRHVRSMFGSQPPEEGVSAQREYTDMVQAIREIRQAVLLGEPGAGKTTTLWRLTIDLVAAAIRDPKAPIPVLVRLGKWTDANQSLTDFIQGELGELGGLLNALIMGGRIALLLDGLNEISGAQRSVSKDAQVRAFIEQAHQANSDLIGVISCRERDYMLDLGFDRIVIAPLDPLHIREFVTRYLDPLKGAGTGEAMFWRLAGGENLRLVWQKWESAGATLEMFFGIRDVPRANPNVYSATTESDDVLWRSKVRIHGTLLSLARNPYMLTMMTNLYRDSGILPDNRGELFTQFVDELIDREYQTNERMVEREADLLASLAKLAYAMQTKQESGGDAHKGTATALPLEEVQPALMDSELLLLGSSCNILAVSDVVRFSHQLLQEYFAAVYIYQDIRAERLKAIDLWKPDAWWEPTGWEEAAILLVGMFPNQLEWVANANPEIAAQCIVRGGIVIPSALSQEYQSRWVQRLTDLKKDPDPRARAAVGRALGLTDLDNRPGVGLRTDGLPDVVWCEVPAGPFIYQAGEKRKLPRFFISRHPITFRQFQAFIDAPDGYVGPKWWNGLHAEGRLQQQGGPGDQYFKFWNHPREDVSWYDAIAFCRWLSTKLGFEISLPTEWQWEKAARGTDGRVYPYGIAYDPQRGNTHDTDIRQTSAVGIFPHGASPYGVLDMFGNVWEWCLNEYNSGKVSIRTKDPRVLRGGSWYSTADLARAPFRLNVNPDNRYGFYGFRVVAVGQPVS